MRWCAGRSAALACATAVALAGCATPAAGPAPSAGAPLPQAVAWGVDDLMAQVQPSPWWLRWFQSRSVVAEPVQEGAVGQQTAATLVVDRLIGQRLAERHDHVRRVSLRDIAAASASLPTTPATTTATWVLNGALVPTAPGADKRGATLHLALADLESGKVVARTTVSVQDAGADNAPTVFYQDSPVLMRDPASLSPSRAAQAPRGASVEPGQAGRLRVSALLDQGTAAYNEGRTAEALKAFQAALALPGGDQTRVHTGIYLSQARLGNAAEARLAFARIAALGMTSRSLSVKFLFAPGKTEFWPDPKVSDPYAMWLEQIATQAAASPACLNIVGHSSRSGSAEVNDRLSQQRAERIGEWLQRTSVDMATRSRASGVGFRENLVGTGSDDARDAIDRRVEFKVVDC
ncbi:MAG: hypothetical protein AD742_17930 [Methylibium sp. NZG]|nr:MAG: hypothetical protein AD742_17930 [Methylibium sp. NZG]